MSQAAILGLTLLLVRQGFSLSRWQAELATFLAQYADTTRVDDRQAVVHNGYLKRARSVEELIPWLYLKGVSTSDYQEPLSALLGVQGKGCRPTRSCD